MGFWDKVSDRADKARYQHIIDNVKQDIEFRYKPCRKIVEEILNSSINCAQKMLENIECKRLKEKNAFEVVLFFEFVYFFMHATLRAASRIMTEEQMEALIEYLSPVISNAAVDAYSIHTSEIIKQKLIDIFFVALNEAELEYSSAPKLGDKENILHENTALYIIGMKVVDASGNSMDSDILSQVIFAALDELVRAKFHALLGEAAKVL